MMKLTVIMDRKGNVVGTARSDPVRVEGTGDTIQFYPVEDEGYEYHEVEVGDDLLQESADRVHETVVGMLNK